jgi:hypothetical protein
VTQFDTLSQTLQTSKIRKVDSIKHEWGTWSIFTPEELATLAHFPGSDLAFERIERISMKTKLPPPQFRSTGSLLGNAEHRREQVAQGNNNNRHVYEIVQAA